MSFFRHMAHFESERHILFDSEPRNDTPFLEHHRLQRSILSIRRNRNRKFTNTRMFQALLIFEVTLFYRSHLVQQYKRIPHH